MGRLNYEDAIILNEKLIMDDSLTSLHIEEYEAEGKITDLKKSHRIFLMSECSKGS